MRASSCDIPSLIYNLTGAQVRDDGVLAIDCD